MFQRAMGYGRLPRVGLAGVVRGVFLASTTSSSRYSTMMFTKGPLQKPSESSVNTHSKRDRRRPGSKPKLIRERVPLYVTTLIPTKKVRRMYSCETKIRVLKFHFPYKLPVEGRFDQYRTPTFVETSTMFLIPESTVQQ